jgi:hypothetical protein
MRFTRPLSPHHPEKMVGNKLFMMLSLVVPFRATCGAFPRRRASMRMIQE